jgi:hypothetical protein
MIAPSSPRSIIARDLGRARASLPFAVAAMAVAAMALAVLAPTPVAAQGGSSGDNILYPQPVLPIYIGPEAGYSWYDAEASFVVSDGSFACAAFANGSGSGPAIGMRSLIYLTEWIALSPRVRYEPRILTFIGPLDPEPARDDRDSIVMLTREAQADATVSSFTFDIRLAIDLFGSGFYLCGGPAFNLMGSGFYDFTERITGPEGFVHEENGSNEDVLATGRSFDSQETFAIDMRAGAGLAIALGRWVINPEGGYTWPMTSSLAPPDLMKQRGFSASFGLLYNFGELR